jgi:hypothetical protein
MDSFTLALLEARRAERDLELSSRNHHRLPRRSERRLRRRRTASS